MHKKIAYLFCLVAAVWTDVSMAIPKQVIIIRHGEKPAIGNTLDQRGYERAAALAPFFQYSTQFKPDAIYAMVNSADTPSLRPMETCSPTAKTLNLPMNIQYDHQQYPAMVKSILTDPKLNGKTVLICWSHGEIPSIAADFGVKPQPAKWPGSVFDQIYVLHFNQQTASVNSFSILPQKLLFGDTTVVQQVGS